MSIDHPLQARALASLRDQLFIDDEWAWGTDRGFSWIAHRYRQDFRLSPIRQSRGLEVFDLTSEVVLVQDVAASRRKVETMLSELNRACVGDGIVWDPANQRILSYCAVTLHEETFEWRMKEFASFAIIQLTQAEIMMDDVARMLEGTPAHSGHPKSGRRQTADDMLQVIAEVFAPIGQQNSRFRSASEFTAAEDWVRESTEFKTFGSSEAGIAVEVPFMNDDTVLVQLDPTIEHPRLGSGLLVTAQLRLPADLLEERTRDEATLAVAVSLVQAEWKGALEGHRYGGWCARDTPAGPTVAHAFFVPNALFRSGVILDLMMAELYRAVWVGELFERDGPGEFRLSGNVSDQQHATGPLVPLEARAKDFPPSTVKELFAPGLAPMGVEFIEDGKSLLALRGGGVEIWDAQSGDRRQATKLSGDLRLSLAWDVEPGGAWILWGGRAGELYKINLKNGEAERLTRPQDLNRLLLGTTTEESTRDAEKPYSTPCSISLSPSAREAVVAYGHEYALIWNLQTRSVPGVLGGGIGSGRVYRVGWSLDGQFILSRDSNGSTIIWDAHSGRQLFHVFTDDSIGKTSDADPDAMTGGVGAVEFTTDSRHLALAEREIVKVVEIETGKEVARWIGHKSRHPILGEYPGMPRIHDICFSDDGQRGMTVGVDSSLRVWNTFTGEELWRVTPDPCCIDWGALAPQGRAVAWAGCPGGRLYSLGKEDHSH